jgi:hypothetical protein
MFIRRVIVTAANEVVGADEEQWRGGRTGME